MSIMKLKWWVERHVTFSKQDIFCNLGGTIPETRSKDTEVPQEGAVAPTATADIGSADPYPAETQGADDAILVSPECTPNNDALPAEPTTSPAETNAENTLPGSAETSLRGNTMILLAEVNTDTLKGLLTNWANSPAEAEGWVGPKTGMVDKLVSSPTPSHQVGEETQCVLTVTVSIGRLNLEATGVNPGDTVIASLRRVAFRNSHMGAALLGPPKERKLVGYQDTTADELAEQDLAKGCP